MKLRNNKHSILSHSMFFFRKNFRKLYLYTFGIIFLFNSCQVKYSLSGVSTDAKTIYVGNFLKRSSNGPANMGIDFTERLKEYYQRNTPLDLAGQEAELLVTGNIEGYTITPIAPTGDDKAAKNRLTIAIEVDFVDTRNDRKNFTQTFSFYDDFEQTQSLAEVETDKIDIIFEQIILDIFNKTVADW